MLIEYNFEDGKYKVVRDDTTHVTTLYRNGEYWEVGTKRVLGDKLFHAILDKVDSLCSIRRIVCKDGSK
jgi:hypothetical protein